MEQDNISQKLKHFNVVPASDDAKERSIMNAVSAFEAEKMKKNVKINQGSPESERLIHKIGRYIDKIGDRIMKKTLITSGVVVACAAVFVLSQSTFLSNPWKDVAVTAEQKMRLAQPQKEYTVPIPDLSEAEDEFIVSDQDITNNALRRNEGSSHTAFDRASPPLAPIQDQEESITIESGHPLLAPPPVPSSIGQVDSSASAPQIVSEELHVQKNERSIREKKLDRSAFAPGMEYDDVTTTQDEIRIAPIVIPPSPEPNVHQNERYQQFIENNVKQVSQEPVSTFSADVDTTSYSIVRKSINNGYFPQTNAVRVEEMINYFNYDYEVPKDKLEPFKPTVALYPSPWNEHTKLMHIGIKGYEVDQTEKPQSNLVFLIDVSGSMHSQNKLPLLKKSFNMLLSSLNPDDTVSIVVYAGAAGTVLEPTQVRDKNKIISALNQLRAGGSTAGAAGIKQAYHLAQQNYVEGGVNRVILATDGDFNVGINNPNQLKQFIAQKRDTGIFLSVLGFGSGNYNDHIMQSLAQNGNGNAAYIDSLQEAQKVLVDEANSTLFTIAKDVKFQVEFNPNRISEYR
ncbi:MAG: VWA domain-containing protein, partial [Rickettsiales bacterium]|nr:VWA domain-containing protein [Rickettsiales bacterium]